MPNLNASNPNDGTVLGTSEVISDEYIDPVLGCRVVNTLPATAYKMPRSKIAVGPYGQDWGDASADIPLQVEQRSLRLLFEQTALRERLLARESLQKWAGETDQLVDSRGSHITHRGVR